MKKSTIISSLGIICLLVASCSTFKGLYDKYESKNQIPSDVLGIVIPDSLVAEKPVAMSWRDFFVDPLLQKLIDSALVRNTDLNSARIAVEQSDISLQMAKKAILPSLYFSPQTSFSSFGSNTSQTYNVPLQASWEYGPIGSITNKKRAANAVLLQSQAREEATRANLISTVAQQYCLLQVLDRQLEILTMTVARNRKNPLGVWQGLLHCCQPDGVILPECENTACGRAPKHSQHRKCHLPHSCHSTSAH